MLGKRILFVTTTNLATNPRLVKEINLAMDNGAQVSVISFRLGNWSAALNEKILEELEGKVIAYTLDISANKSLRWAVDAVRFFVTRKIGAAFSSQDFQGMTDRRSVLLDRFLRRMKVNFDLVVAHNPGSILPVWRFSKSRKIPFGFDIEDYHPGESSLPETNLVMKRIFNSYLKDARYLTAASPLILTHSLEDIGVFHYPAETVLNYFPRDEFEIPVPASAEVPLRVIWFSQNINAGRGLEQISDVLGKFGNELSVTLVGNLNGAFYEKFLKRHTNLNILAPLPQRELHRMLRQYDVGLAIEPGKDINNGIAVSNKMLAYHQAGLFIAASDTPAQTAYMEAFPGNGVLFPLGSPPAIIETLQRCVANKTVIRQHSGERFRLAHDKGWEAESLKLANLWNSVLSKNN
ncbi:hypothetical protein [Flavihumibacter petaseus]|uniref:Glycosyltransferase n=1 Tax=Flavihumibacter petaseus NBRC 106054 TaxID=1220578 RepID=A0A0E9N5G4_9BACT|nr:hypothetical protein [Flavihumibacter petaseus]GAO45212.1 hypothetical protein FPE01S_04_04560 [Flavihumibacter petaseus NBRC 106054]